MTVPETAYTPSEAVLSLGLYAADSYRLAVSSAQGESLGDSLTLGDLKLEPRTTEFPNALDQNFNNEIRLIGYEYSQRQLKPGEELNVTLYWESLQKQTVNYLVQVLLLDESGKVWVAADNRPQPDTAPTLGWQPGQIVKDTHRLALDANLPADSYVIHVALIDEATKEAQNIVAEDGHWIDNRLLLARVRVQP